MRVTWRSIAPIFADVVVSPWNLLIGGILIQHLSLFNAIVSIIFGYFILACIFILYGGLGFKKRKQSSQLLSEVFGSKLVKYIVPIILALGQIGWAAINLDLGGRSLAALFSLPWFLGIVIYTVILLAMTLLRLPYLGFTKIIITLSSLSLMGYMFLEKLHTSSFTAFIYYQPTSTASLFWGTSIIVASLISFSTVTPDFFKSVKTKKDVVLSTFVGLSPGMIVAFLGCFLFFDKHTLDLIPLLGLTTIPIFPHIFNMLTNTDGTTAIYTPALKLQSILLISFKKGVFLAGLASFALALTQISSHITVWLTMLSVLFPSFIGVCFSAIVFKKISKQTYYYVEIFSSLLFSVIIAIVLAWFFPPVLLSLLIPILFFTFSAGYVNLSLF